MATAITQGRWLYGAALAVPCAMIGVIAGIDPRLAVFAALGLVFVVVAFADLSAGLVVLIVVSFLERTALAGPTLSFTKLVGLLLLLSWLARIATQHNGRARLLFESHPVLSYLLILYLAWIGVSISWAENSGEAITDASRLVLVAILFVIVYTAVGTRRQAWWVTGGFVVGATITAAYGLAAGAGTDPGATARLSSTVTDPNALAAFLVAGTALALAAFFAWRGSTVVRIASGGAAAICLVAFLLTGSRGGLAAFSVALLVSVVFAGRWRGVALGTALLALTAALAYYTIYAPSEIAERVTSASAGQIEQDESRLTIWQVGWRMFEANPVEGVGIGNFKESSIHHVLEPGSTPRTDKVVDRPSVAHNSYLQVLAELGVVGAALFLSVAAFSVGCAVVAARTFERNGEQRMEILARGLVVALAGKLTADFFITENESKITWLLLALGPTLLAIARSQPTAAELGFRTPRR